MIAAFYPYSGPSLVDTLPAINAAFNGLSTLLLITGFVLIRRGKWRAHGITMLAATVSSALFLIGYVAHKAILHGVDIKMSRFPNLSHAWKYTYWFAILIPHLVLAMAMLP